MYYNEFILAVVLLTSPDTTLGLNPTKSDTLMNFRDAAVHLEIMDEGEGFFRSPMQFKEDLKVLRERYEQLKDAPFLADCQRFPSREAVKEVASINFAYREHITARQSIELNHWWHFDTILKETRMLYNIWDTVDDCQAEHRGVVARRESLRQLREAIGPEDYYRGVMPPPVPIWRFQRID